MNQSEIKTAIDSLRSLHAKAVEAYKQENAQLRQALDKKVASDAEKIDIRDLATKVANDLIESGSLSAGKKDAFISSIVADPGSLGKVYSKVASFQEPANDFGSVDGGDLNTPDHSEISPRDRPWLKLVRRGA